MSLYEGVVRRISWAALVGFALSVGFALHERWSVAELCWGFWISGLCCSWTFVLVGSLRILFVPVPALPLRFREWSLVSNLPEMGWRGLIGLAALAIGGVMYHVYAYLFGFYGIFLSVFAEMEPHFFFGRNGFINSDFYGPVVALLERFWPMVLGAIVTDFHFAATGSPWRVPRLQLSAQLLPIHIMILGLPFVSLLLWWLFGDMYQVPAAVLVLALFHFFPRGERGERRRAARSRAAESGTG